VVKITTGKTMVIGLQGYPVILAQSAVVFKNKLSQANESIKLTVNIHDLIIKNKNLLICILSAITHQLVNFTSP
jgi:hypothetical protein